MNEIADVLADAVDREESVAVVRLPGRSSSMHASYPKYTVRRWVAPRAQAQVHARLLEMSHDTIYQRASDLELGQMADGDELLCQAVASERCQVGDAKRVWSLAAKGFAATPRASRAPTHGSMCSSALQGRGGYHRAEGVGFQHAGCAGRCWQRLRADASCASAESHGRRRWRRGGVWWRSCEGIDAPIFVRLLRRGSCMAMQYVETGL